jgi:hypothetical protein
MAAGSGSIGKSAITKDISLSIVRLLTFNIGGAFLEPRWRLFTNHASRTETVTPSSTGLTATKS